MTNFTVCLLTLLQSLKSSLESRPQNDFENKNILLLEIGIHLKFVSN